MRFGHNMIAVFLMVALEARAQGWTSLNSGNGNDLNSVFFTAADTGFAVGANSTLLKTTDGGINWIRSSTGIPSSAGGVRAWNLNTIHFTTHDSGFVSGWAYDLSSSEYYGLVYRTADGGNNWILGYYGPTVMWDVACASSSRCFAGGGSWQSPTYYTVISRMTGDGGASWSAFNSSRGIRDIHFASTQAGFIYFDSSGGNLTAQGFLFRSLDGGINWSRRQGVGLNSGYPSKGTRSIHFTDSLVGYAVGAGGAIRKTVDGGDNWADQISGTSVAFQDAFFLDSIQGHVVGAGGVIRKTTDGGMNWVQQTSGITTDLNSVFFVNSALGFAAGSGGVILRYGLPVKLSSRIHSSPRHSYSGRSVDAIGRRHDFENRKRVSPLLRISR